MFAARRLISIPLFCIGGLFFLAGYGGGLAVGLYFEVVSILQIVHGHVLEGIITGGVVMMLAVTLVGLLNIPGAAFLAGASKLWGAQRQEPGTYL